MKYKIQKKVKQANKKANKLARKNGTAGKMKKDPGVPKLFPFKEEFLRKQNEQLEREKARHTAQRTGRLHELSQQHGLSGIELMKADADRRQEEFEAVQREEAGGAAPTAAATGGVENSRKTYYKEFKKVVDAADVILEVLDARDPLGCRCARIERQVLAAGAGKRLVLILNKVDLVPQEVVAKWLAFLRNDFPTMAFKASTQAQATRLKQHAGDAVGGKNSAASACFGAAPLLSLLGNYSRSLDIRTGIKVGVVGYPNVGKSSIINSLKRSRVCGVGASAGFTKVCQEISLDKHVKLIDSPGIVFADSETGNDLILRNCVKLESMADPIEPVEAILNRCDPAKIMEKYMVPEFTNVTEFLQHLARRLGKLKKGGVPDIGDAARVILQDWNCGKISFYTTPPETHTLPAHISASVVQSWGDAFDMSALMASDEAILPSLMRMEDCKGIALSAAPEVDMEDVEDVETENAPAATGGKPSRKSQRVVEATMADTGEAYDFGTDYVPATSMEQ